MQCIKNTHYNYLKYQKKYYQDNKERILSNRKEYYKMNKEKCIQWLHQLPAEQNRITRQWQVDGIGNKSALDSQALIELTNHYCINRRCLDCAIGNKILKNGL